MQTGPAALSAGKKKLFSRWVEYCDPDQTQMIKSSKVLQGIFKECFPGCENKGWKNCVFLPAAGKQNATFSSNFTQPGKRSLEIPCMYLSLPTTNIPPMLPVNALTKCFNKLRKINFVKFLDVLGAPLWLARGLEKLVLAVAYHLCSIYLQHSRNHMRTIKGCPVWRSAKREVLYRWFSEICSPSCLAFRKKLHRRSQTVFEVIFSHLSRYWFGSRCLQRSTRVYAPGCVNSADQLRQKW